ncbi:hypothetical protein CKO15_11350 [Halorhodospira abdelmalekii]|uniref:hypothetical protein n=1 Tax=Halorhodospira abdelmalekii TaxID=421629 RepID=UPI00190732FC|nr:hypothetical protein [Halorhodospira abdelmalekii]MBK1735862.1 hypothetical protein [Halorhodospira abdelmalekii]
MLRTDSPLLATPERLLRELSSPLKKPLGRKQLADAAALLAIWPTLAHSGVVTVVPGGAADERDRPNALAEACRAVGDELGGVAETAYHWLAERLLRYCTGDEREAVQTALRGATGLYWKQAALARALLRQSTGRHSVAFGVAEMLHAALADSVQEVAVIGNACTPLLAVLAEDAEHRKEADDTAAAVPRRRLILTDHDLAEFDRPPSRLESTAPGVAIALGLVTRARLEHYSSLAEALFAAYSSDAFFSLLTELPQQLTTEAFVTLAERHNYAISAINPFEPDPERAHTQGYLLVPGRLLHHPAHYALRQHAVELGLLQAVVQLPEETLPALKSPHLVAFSRERCPSQEILFLNASQLEAAQQRNTNPSRQPGTAAPEANWHRRLGEQIRQRQPDGEAAPGALVARDGPLRNNKYDCSVQLYARGAAQNRIESLQQRRRTQPLKAVAELIRGQSLTDLAAEGAAGEPLLEERTPYRFRELSPAHLGESGLIEPATLPWESLRAVAVTHPKAVHRGWNQRLESGDILLTIKGNPGTVALVETLPETDEPIVANQSFLIIRPHAAERHTLPAAEPAPSSTYLFHYLTSTVVQNYFAAIARGSAIPLLRAADIRDLPIPLPTAAELEAVHTHHEQTQARYQQIRELQAENAAAKAALERQHWSFV